MTNCVSGVLMRENDIIDYMIMKRIFNYQAELKATEPFVKTWFAACRPEECFNLPLPLLYCRNGKYELLPYLDLSRKNEICAIKVGDMAFALKHELHMDGYEVQSKKHATQHGFIIKTVPDWEALVSAGKLYSQFMTVAGLLLRFRVEVETWRPGVYFSSTLANEEQIACYDILEHRICCLGLAKPGNLRMAYNV